MFGFLYARPSFLGGIASVLDLGDTLTEFNNSLTPEQADYIAIKADVQAIAGDMRQVAQELSAQRRR
jgi:hypothetical protein